MIDIKILHLAKHNKEEFKLVENGIYKNLKDDDIFNYRIALSYELEDGESSQYPLEDILDKYNLYVSDFLDSYGENKSNPSKVVHLELAGALEGVRKAAALVGKRVYNKNFIGKDGRKYVDLIIE